MDLVAVSQATEGATPTGWSAELTPVRGDDEKQAGEGERNACDDRSRCANLEARDFGGDEPDTGKQDQQESDFREGDARLMAESEHGHHGSDSNRSALPLPGGSEPERLVGAGSIPTSRSGERACLSIRD